MKKDQTKQVDIVEEKKVFDEKIEGYQSCGNSSAAYKCKKDCIFVYTSLISAIT